MNLKNPYGNIPFENNPSVDGEILLGTRHKIGSNVPKQKLQEKIT
jgi:hypothetical protein